VVQVTLTTAVSTRCLLVIAFGYRVTTVPLALDCISWCRL